MIVGSLFSGAGLLDKGLHDAGIDHAWFVEREPERRALLAARWPGRPVHDDVRTVGAHNLERVDGIVGGFPCKGASNAGPRNGFDHPETALWAEFWRIVRELRPRYVAVENVAAIRNLHLGAVWGTVLGDLAALGYDVAWGCVRASDVGAPHGRDRILAVARHAAHVGPERAGCSRHGRDGLANAGPLAADAARDGEGGSGAAGGSDRERARPCADVAADAGGAPGRQHAGDAHGSQAGDGGRSTEHDHEPGGAGSSRLPAAEALADTRGGRRSGEGRRGPFKYDESAARADDQGRDVAVEWGEYGPAIRRWEAIHGPAPAPLTRVRGVDDGGAKLHRLRARMDRQRLSALGDGVHVYVGRLVGDALMELAAADEEARDAA